MGRSRYSAMTAKLDCAEADVSVVWTEGGEGNEEEVAVGQDSSWRSSHALFRPYMMHSRGYELRVLLVGCKTFGGPWPRFSGPARLVWSISV